MKRILYDAQSKNPSDNEERTTYLIFSVKVCFGYEEQNSNKNQYNNTNIGVKQGVKCRFEPKLVFCIPILPTKFVICCTF